MDSRHFIAQALIRFGLPGVSVWHPIIRSSGSGIVISIITCDTLACVRHHGCDSTQALTVMNSDPKSLLACRMRWGRDWLCAVAEFADYDLQRKSWSGGEQYDGPYWSYVEWTCCYFNDLGLDSGYRVVIEEGLVSREEAEAAQTFHVAFDAYEPPNEDSHDFEAILSDPSWQRVVSLADGARLLLLTLITDPVERDILTRNHD